MGNFHAKTQKSTDFAHTFSKNYIFFVFFTKDYTFYTKNLFIRPKNCVQSNIYNERWKEFRKNHFLVTSLHFEYNLRIIANFGKFSRNNSKIYGFRPYVLKQLQFFFLYYLIKLIHFTLKIYLIGPKITFKSFFTTKDAKSFVKINFLVKFLHF